ncbi:unnamed protein product [Symbiodinium necroappetens]|uniref:Uncharacterized protein n=1 Tax=Symbiodinium necroappetens TaxID=1628268 RepID=A0A813BMG9_9DINO|nr:unnamed protein product [Symbiodinium necroappetens]
MAFRLDNELMQDSLLHVRRHGHGDVEDNILHFSCTDALDEPLGALWLSSYTPPLKRGRHARSFRGIALPKPQTGAVRLAFWRSSFAIAPVWSGVAATAPSAVRVTYAVARRPSSAASIFPSRMYREVSNRLAKFKDYLHIREKSAGTVVDCDVYNHIERHLLECAPHASRNDEVSFEDGSCPSNWSVSGLARRMRLLKKVGDLLDTADEKTTEANLDTLTRHVGDAFGGNSNEASGIKLDLGIVEGLADLKNQIGTDLKGLGVQCDRGSESDAGVRLAALKERVEELHAKEAERAEQRSRLQTQLLEVESAINEKSCVAEASTTRQPVQDSRLEELRREFHEREAQALQRAGSLAATTTQIAANNDHLSQQLDFWKEKARCRKISEQSSIAERKAGQLLASLGLETVPEEVEHAAQLEEGREQSEAADQVKSTPAASTPDAGVVKEHADEQCAVQDLEAMLAELMRRSEEIMGRVEQQRHQERALPDLLLQLGNAQDSPTTDTAAKEANAVSEFQTQLETLRQTKAELLLKIAVGAIWCNPLSLEQEVSAKAAAAPARMDEVMQLRAEVETLRACLESSTKERWRLEAQLGKHRAAAAADLERAVPSSTTTCWTWLDVPLMRLVTLLVKSTCLRRSFALHLLATFRWKAPLSAQGTGGCATVHTSWQGFALIIPEVVL